MRLASLILVLVAIGARPVEAKDPVGEILLNTKVIGEEADNPSSRSLSVLVEVNRDRNGVLRSHEFFRELVSSELFRLGVTHQVRDGAWLSRFRDGSLSIGQALEPKLAVDVSLRVEPQKGYETTTTVTLIDYKKSGLPELGWRKDQVQIAATTSEANDNIIRSIQRALKEARSSLRSSSQQRQVFVNSNKASRNGAKAEAVYKTRWIDPDPKRGSLFLGVSGGTPALFNLHVGYWGPRDVPLVLSLSCMYFDSRTRGLQVELGWTVDNEGSFKHGPAALTAWLPVESSNEVLQQDVIGRVSSVEKITEVSMHPFVGGGYFADWRNFRAFVGGAAPVVGGDSFRLLLQLGYTQPLGF